MILVFPDLATLRARGLRRSLSWKTRDFVDQARIAGAGSGRIIMVHILPNVLNSVVVLSTLQVGWAVMVEASLSFLGAGIPPPTPTWGLMISEGRGRIADAWWISLIPRHCGHPAGAVGQPVRRLAARPARSQADQYLIQDSRHGRT